jgi:uncharacterized coiled-coil DUF342 family protein
VKPSIASLQAENLQLRTQIESLQLQQAREREDHARRITELRSAAPSGALSAQAEAKINELRAEIASLTKARDKFKNDWTEALRWSGHWKSKYQMLTRRLEQAVDRAQERKNGGSFQERKAAALAEAQRTGQPARV